MPRCPRCDSDHVVKNGLTHNGKQGHRCQDCRRSFVLNPQKGPVSDEKKELIRRLLAERVSLRAIHRVTGVALSWIQNFVNDLSRQTPHEPGPAGKKGGT